MLCCVSAGKAVWICFCSLYCKLVAYLHNLKENWPCSVLSKLTSDEYVRLIVSEPFVHLPRDFPVAVKACSPGDPSINIAYLAERTEEKVGCIGKLPQRPVPNRIWQVYSEVEIQMCGGHREWLLDQLFPIIVTVVNCVPQHLHLWWKKKKTPNICRMINLTTSPPIRGWMSLTVSSEYITIPGQVCSTGCWQMGSCIHQWNDRDISCSHLLPTFIAAWRSRSHACSHRCLFARVTSPRAKTFVQLRPFFFLFLQSSGDTLWLHPGHICHEDTTACSIFVRMDLIPINRLFVSLLNYPSKPIVFK